MKLALTNFSLKRPWLVIALVLVVCTLFLAQFPKVRFDNDPENMLSAEEPVRLFHHQVKEKFALYDFVIVGIVNDQHPDGVFNVDTLGRIHDLTAKLLSLQPTAEGLPSLLSAGQDGSGPQRTVLDLSPGSACSGFSGPPSATTPTSCSTNRAAV